MPKEAKMSECALTDLEGMDWDVDGGYWYSVANGDVSPERLLAYTILLEAKLTAIECGDCGLTMLECACDEVE